jgi:adenosylcobinamide kinase/adenosylcobinamide-phosphate guanylyltransferase
MAARAPWAFVATAEALDAEMAERVAAHRRARGDAWRTFEEPVQVAKVLAETSGRFGAAVVDCLTLWLSNLLTRRGDGDSRPEEEIERVVEAARGWEGLLVVVANEVGMGIVPDNALARRFRELAGELNQRMAELADEVYVLFAGLPVRLK